MSPVIETPRFVEPDDMEALAREVREETGVTKIPVDPFAIAARLGIRVQQVTFEEESVEGLLRFAEGAAVIFISESARSVRQRFTVAHEIGHMKLHWAADEEHGDHEEFVDADFQLYRRGRVDPRSKADRDREIQANMFAAALLMPRDDVITYLPRAASVRDLARTFGVSELAMHYRINELDVW